MLCNTIKTVLLGYVFISGQITLPFILADSLIKTPSSYITIENVTPHTTLIGCNNKSLTNVTVTHISKTTTTNIIVITTNKGSIHACPDQLFYDPVTSQWIPAQCITTHTTFLDTHFNHCPCLNVTRISVPLTDVYHIPTTTPHNFFISDQELLTHNFFPIAIGLGWVFGNGIAFAGLTIEAAIANI